MRLDHLHAIYILKSLKESMLDKATYYSGTCSRNLLLNINMHTGLQNQTSEGIGSQTEISIEEAAEKACIRPDILLKECSSVVSLDLAKFCVDWKLIGRRAGLTEGDLTAVDGDNRTVEEKRVGMMEKWKSKFAYKATYRTFIEALLEEGRCADAIEACKAIQAAEG